MPSQIDNLIYERIDSLPLIISLARKLKIDTIINSYFRRHGNMQGIGYGELTVGWLSFILTQANHRKSHAEKWAQERPLTLKALLSHKLRDKDFSDDRLSNLLSHLSNDEKWQEIERELWKAKVDVYEIPVESVRLDGTNTYGYHKFDESTGLMQIGFSKEGKHNLPLLKLMVGVEGNTGTMIASDVAAGNKNDDILYMPLIHRIRLILGKRGLLYCGDSKMSSFGIRASLNHGNDYYLTPLQKILGREDDFNQWIKDIVIWPQQATLVWNKDKLIGGGYEFYREQIDKENSAHKWIERVIVFRSLDLAKTQIDGLEKRLEKAKSKIIALIAPSKTNKPKDLKRIEESVNKIIINQNVEGLLKVTWKTSKSSKEYQRTEKRKGVTRNGSYTIDTLHYELSRIDKDIKGIKDLHDKFGWRIYVTNMNSQQLSMENAVIFYRDGWKIESSFHFLKSHPINIQPLYVKGEDQLKGLSRLLTVALRLWSHMEMIMHKAIDESQRCVKGIYKGQPKKITKTPSGALITDAFEKISLFGDKSRELSITQPGELSELFLELLEMKNVFTDLLKQIKKFLPVQRSEIEL